jgi:siroheme decarboxylase
MSTDALDLALIDRLQDGMTPVERPFARVAGELGIGEDEVIARVKRLVASGALSRIGPMYNADRLGGTQTLAALAVPEPDFEAVAAFVNAYPEVAHNYRRDHRYNMWFVVAAEREQRVAQVLQEIERHTELPVLELPKLDEYFLRLRLPLGAPQ